VGYTYLSFEAARKATGIITDSRQERRCCTWDRDISYIHGEAHTPFFGSRAGTERIRFLIVISVLFLLLFLMLGVSPLLFLNIGFFIFLLR
jgi:hypothetical protein